MVSRGLAVTPGVSMSTRKALTPRDPGPPVRASTMHRVAWSAQLVHSFSAIDHPTVAVWRAVVRIEPEIACVGLGEPQTTNLVRRAIAADVLDQLGRAELGHRRAEHLMHRPGRGVHQRSAPASSSPRTARRIGEPPRPPIRAGHPHRIQPASNSSRCTRRSWFELASTLWSSIAVRPTRRPRRSTPAPRRETSATSHYGAIRSQASINPEATYASRIGGFRSSGNAVAAAARAGPPTGSPSSDAPTLNPSPTRRED